MPPESPSSQRSPVILMVAGEASGDAHGAELIHAIKEKQPQGAHHRRRRPAHGVGRAGAASRSVGACGAGAGRGAEAIFQVPQISRPGARPRQAGAARRGRADRLLRLQSPAGSGAAPRSARHADHLLHQPAGLGLAAGRVKAMQRDIDLLLAILPFREGVVCARRHRNSTCSGWGIRCSTASARSRWPSRIPTSSRCLPGSRKTEVEKHLPVLWEAALIMGRNRPGLKFILLSPERGDPEIFAGDAGEISRAEFHLRVQRRLRHLASLALRAGARGVGHGLARVRAGRHSAGRRLSRPSADLCRGASAW